MNFPRDWALFSQNTVAAIRGCSLSTIERDRWVGGGIPYLLNHAIVESDRLEFKADWNPEAILRTICAFANDFNNFGGGYIVIGVEENEGNPIFPPKGITKEQVDKIQKEIVRICSYLKPAYTPIVSFEN